MASLMGGARVAVLLLALLAPTVGASAGTAVAEEVGAEPAIQYTQPFLPYGRGYPASAPQPPVLDGAAAEAAQPPVTDTGSAGTQLDADAEDAEAETDPKRPFPPTDPMAYLWWVFIFYMFFVMAIVCDDYLVPTVDIMCERFEIPEDVAGATLMAFACNGPELLTNFCAIFITHSAVGMGTIVGSAIFNVMVIVGVCPIATATGVLEIPKATFLRDAGFSAISIVALFWALPVVNLTKASVLFGLAFVYTFVVAKFNTWFGPMTDKELEAIESRGNLRASQVFGDEDVGAVRKLSPVEEAISEADSSSTHASQFSDRKINRRATEGLADPMVSHLVDPSPLLAVEESDRHIARTVSREFVNTLIGKKKQWQRVSVKEAYTMGPHHREDLWEPIETTKIDHTEGLSFAAKLQVWICFILAAPTTFVLHMTIPDVKQEVKKGLYVRSFIGSMFWLSATAFVVCMGSDAINYYWGIPQSFLGLTLTAIGTSFPNMFASMITARTGRGPIAVSNALGSNVQNVFLVLALPIWIRVLQKGEYVMQGDDIMASIVWMAVALAICVAAVVFKGYQLTYGMGLMFMLIYVVYVVQTTLSST